MRKEHQRVVVDRICYRYVYTCWCLRAFICFGYADSDAPVTKLKSLKRLVWGDEDSMLHFVKCIVLQKHVTCASLSQMDTLRVCIYIYTIQSSYVRREVHLIILHLNGSGYLSVVVVELNWPQKWWS